MTTVDDWDASGENTLFKKQLVATIRRTVGEATPYLPLSNPT